MLSLRRHPGLVSAVSVLVLGVYLMASLGVLPSPRVVAGLVGQLSDERYPCESCGCGCASATECWTHCCCHSEHARLVWAIENGVMPPSVVQFSDEQWIAAANDVRPGLAHCVLCVERIKGELQRGIATARVCEHGGTCDGHCDTTQCAIRAGVRRADGSCCSDGGKARESSRPGPSISALSCKGLSQLLRITLPPTPPMRVAALILPQPIPHVPERPKDVVYPSRTLEVPEPPPRPTPARD